MRNISHQRLVEVLEYDPAGGFRNKIARGKKAKIGEKAGGKTLDKDGYRQVRIDGVQYKEHRLVYFYHHKRWPQPGCDHINRVRDDNRIENLREADQALNVKNSAGRPPNSLGRGVRHSGRKFSARASVSRKEIYLGTFTTVEGARAAVSKWRNL